MTQFAFTDDQDDLRCLARDFLKDKSPESEVRRLMETPAGFDGATWQQMGEQLGILGLPIPEEYGGAGRGLCEVGIVLEEAGRVLFCAPYFSSVLLATTALMCAGDESAKQEYLPRLANGEVRGTIAVIEDDGRWESGAGTTTATHRGSNWRLDGHKSYVIDGATADFLVVLAQTDAGPSLFLVLSGAVGLGVVPLSTLDLTRRQARLTFEDVDAIPLGTAGDAWRVLHRVGHFAAAGLAAEQAGGAAQTLETAVSYVKTRFQYGRPIGSFQAIKHKCADMLIDVESARSAAYYALWVASDEDEFPRAASTAKAFCSEAFLRCAHQNLQIHGGVGFTWEHSAHLYLRRAKSSQLLFGDATQHRELVAQSLGL